MQTKVKLQTPANHSCVSNILLSLVSFCCRFLFCLLSPPPPASFFFVTILPNVRDDQISANPMLFSSFFKILILKKNDKKIFLNRNRSSSGGNLRSSGAAILALGTSPSQNNKITFIFTFLVIMPTFYKMSLKDIAAHVVLPKIARWATPSSDFWRYAFFLSGSVPGLLER